MKSILLTILLFILALGVQSKNTSIQKQVTEFKLNATDFNELVNIDWDQVRNLFKDTRDNQEITLSFSYKNKSKENDEVNSIGNLKLSFGCKKSEFENTIKTIDKIFKKLFDLQKEGE